MALRQLAVGGKTLPSLLNVLRKDISKPHRVTVPLPSLRRTFSLYDQINLIDNIPEDQLRFQGFDETGFKVNGVKYEGSLLCAGNLLMSWTPKNFADITPESSLKMVDLEKPWLSLLCKESALSKRAAIEAKKGGILRPIPEILILGCGRHIEPVNSELRSYLRSAGIRLEAVDSRNAASTYNILNEEGRIVAAALLPYGASASS